MTGSPMTAVEKVTSPRTMSANVTSRSARGTANRSGGRLTGRDAAGDLLGVERAAAAAVSRRPAGRERRLTLRLEVLRRQKQ